MTINSPKPLFSICVLTYNRGLSALTAVVNILPKMDDSWELLILDNASEHDTNSYEKIAQFTQIDSRLRYIRHAHNLGFHGNFLATFEHASAEHIMILSDEDFANTDMIRKVLPMLKADPELAILRGGIGCLEGQKPRNTISYLNMAYGKGKDALLNFNLHNIYMSGVIYNRELLLQSGVITLLQQGINENSIHPHRYLDMLVSAKFDVATTQEIACFEGEERPLLGNDDYASPNSFGSCIDQFVVLRNGVRQAISLMPEPFNHNLFVDMYLMLCDNYMCLISKVNGTLYINNMLYLPLIQDSMLQIFYAALFDYPEYLPYQDYLTGKLQAIHTKYQAAQEFNATQNSDQAVAA